MFLINMSTKTRNINYYVENKQLALETLKSLFPLTSDMNSIDQQLLYTTINWWRDHGQKVSAGQDRKVHHSYLWDLAGKEPKAANPALTLPRSQSNQAPMDLQGHCQAGTDLGPIVPVNGNLNSIQGQSKQLFVSNILTNIQRRTTYVCDGQLSFVFK